VTGSDGVGRPATGPSPAGRRVSRGRAAAVARLLAAWNRARTAVAAAMFGLSGSLTAGTFQHAFQSCRGNCVNCGSCALALGGAVAAASAGIAARASGRRRLLGFGAAAAAGLLLFGILYAWKSGLARPWLGI